jgi:hypothetical protein
VAVSGIERWPVRGQVDRKGLSIESGKEKGKLLVRAAADAEPGIYWIRLYDDQSAWPLRPFVVGVLPEVTEKEPNDDAGKPQRVDLPATVNGRLQNPGDVDCFGVQLHRGQTLVADVAAHETFGSPMDAVLQVISSRGFVLEANHDHTGLDPRLAFTAPEDGLYVVRLFAFPATPDATIGFAGGPEFLYRLTLTTGGFADHPFPLAVSRDRPAIVEMIGWNIPEAASRLTVAAGDADFAALFHPQFASPPLRVRHEPHPAIVQAADNDRSHPQSITLPVTISGKLDRPRGGHAYRFGLKKGQAVLFEVESAALGFLLDAALTLTDDSGKPLARAETTALHTDPQLHFTVPQDGTYRLEIRDHRGTHGPRHLYCLRAVPAAPDFALSIAADHFTMTPSKPLAIPVTLERRLGLASEIELAVEGLPAGVTAAAVVAVPSATTATVTLTCGASTAPASGGFHITGKVRGKAAPLRHALAPIEGLAVKTADLWLTVRKP